MPRSTRSSRTWATSRRAKATDAPDGPRSRSADSAVGQARVLARKKPTDDTDSPGS